MVMFDIPAAVEVRKRFPSRLFQAGFFCLLNNRGNAGLPDSVLRTGYYLHQCSGSVSVTLRP